MTMPVCGYFNFLIFVNLQSYFFMTIILFMIGFLVFRDLYKNLLSRICAAIIFSVILTFITCSCFYLYYSKEVTSTEKVNFIKNFNRLNSIEPKNENLKDLTQWGECSISDGKITDYEYNVMLSKHLKYLRNLRNNDSQ